MLSQALAGGYSDFEFNILILWTDGVLE